MPSDAPLVIEGPAQRRRRRVRLVYWLFAAAVFTATHWPKLKVPGPENSDKVLHIAAFGTWTALFVLCGWFGRPLSARNLALSAVVSFAYSGLDEALQGVEFIGRTCSWADFAANAAGVALATVSLLALRMAWRGPGIASAEPGR